MKVRQIHEYPCAERVEQTVENLTSAGERINRSLGIGLVRPPSLVGVDTSSTLAHFPAACRFSEHGYATNAKCLAFVTSYAMGLFQYAGLPNGSVGEWNLFMRPAERPHGPDVGDMRAAFNEAARMKADSWNADSFATRTTVHSHHRTTSSRPGMVAKKLDPLSRQLVALRTHISWQAPERWIWMDGRPHRMNCRAHLAAAFRRERWLGQVLKSPRLISKTGWDSTHGVPRSDQAELTE